jgi:hypothetical protein
MPRLLKDKTVLKVPTIFGGSYEFGRERMDYDDFGSRLNWAYIQAKSVAETNKHKKGSHLTPDQLKFIKQHKNDVELLEKVLKENLKVNKIEWFIVTSDEHDELKAAYTGPDYKEYDYMKQFYEGYIDHGSLWYENCTEYLNVFENENSIFDWLFGDGNYIANRSDEYDDASSIQVDHTCDYKYDIDDLYYDPWNTPEHFSCFGKFLPEVDIYEGLDPNSDFIQNALQTTEKNNVNIMVTFQPTKVKTPKDWKVDVSEFGSDKKVCVRFWKVT